MPERQKTCLQEQFPEYQTPCFSAAGGRCDEPTCYVASIMRMMAETTGEKVKLSELHDIFHCFCIQSNMGFDRSGFTQRVTARIENGEL